MKNSADLRGYYISTEAEGDLQNSSNHTRPHSIIAKYYLGQTKVLNVTEPQVGGFKQFL